MYKTPYPYSKPIWEDVGNGFIDDIYEENDIILLIVKHLEKKKILKNESLEDKKKKKLSDYLIRKGFTWGQINEVYTEWGIN